MHRLWLRRHVLRRALPEHGEDLRRGHHPGLRRDLGFDRGVREVQRRLPAGCLPRCEPSFGLQVRPGLCDPWEADDRAGRDALLVPRRPVRHPDRHVRGRRVQVAPHVGGGAALRERRDRLRRGVRLRGRRHGHLLRVCDLHFEGRHGVLQPGALLRRHLPVQVERHGVPGRRRRVRPRRGVLGLIRRLPLRCRGAMGHGVHGRQLQPLHMLRQGLPEKFGGAMRHENGWSEAFRRQGTGRRCRSRRLSHLHRPHVLRELRDSYWQCEHWWRCVHESLFLQPVHERDLVS
mmetsp:Transcript_84614/g.244560  ORF Transcript_84614/g.244560 Transcript_84614/m.244560 type:complete len:290 (+) Transcript_84614:1716-2585(+)